MTKKESGFTLIEVILSLVLFGFIAVVAGMGIVSFTKGVVFAKKSSHTAQKIQLAMIRLNRELLEITDIAAKDDSQPDPYIIYDNISGRHALAKDGDVIKMFFNLAADADELPSTGGNKLIDDVESLTLTYYQNYQTSQSWAIADGIDQLSSIEIQLALSDIGGSFSTLIFPRNR
ncbi:prepilin-type N-terminal cleavage/methylation domain-containing protein [Thermodesulfobacteriota bacterium]